VFDKQIHGLLASLREKNGVLFLRKRLLDQFAIYRGIIRYQDLQFAGRWVHCLASMVRGPFNKRLQ
jgi:hypothetical protein